MAPPSLGEAAAVVGDVKADAGAVLASLAIERTLGTNADAVAPELRRSAIAACARLRVVFDKADDGAVCKTLLRLMLDVFCSPPLMATLNADGVRFLVTEFFERLVDRRLNDGSFDGAASEGLMKSINQLMLKLLQLAPYRIALGVYRPAAEHAGAGERGASSGRRQHDRDAARVRGLGQVEARRDGPSAAAEAEEAPAAPRRRPPRRRDAAPAVVPRRGARAGQDAERGAASSSPPT